MLGRLFLLDEFNFQKKSQMKFPHLELTYSYITANRKNSLFWRNGLGSITDDMAWFHGAFASSLVSVTLAREFSKAKVMLWA